MLSLGFVFTVQWFRFGGGVAHYLTRRYIFLQTPDVKCDLIHTFERIAQLP